MVGYPVLEPHNFVLGAEKLTSVFGRWPDFHDAEILSLWLDRTGPCLVMRISVFETHRDVVDERGFYQTTDHCAATLRFEDVQELSIEGLQFLHL